MENKEIDKAARAYAEKEYPHRSADPLTLQCKNIIRRVIASNAFIAGARSFQSEIDELREALEEFDKRYRAFFLHNKEVIGNLPYSGKLHEAHKKASQLLEKYGNK